MENVVTSGDENRSNPRSSQEQERFPVSLESETVEAMPESVGNRLRRARKHRGLTLDALAALAGVDQTAISKQDYKKDRSLRSYPSIDP